MKSWQIFAHSVRQIFGNAVGVLRVSGFLFLVRTAVYGILAVVVAGGDSVAKAVVAGLMVLLVETGTSLWIAVGWHRYILLNEQPSVVPQLWLNRILAYLGGGVVIGLIMIVPTLVIAWITLALANVSIVGPSDLFSWSFQIKAVLISAAVYIPVGAIALRLSTVMPGVALREGRELFDGWNATKDQISTFLVVSALGTAAYFSLDLAANYLLAITGSAVVVAVSDAIFQWLAMMVGFSILTTLYGHYIEMRPLV